MSKKTEGDRYVKILEDLACPMPPYMPILNMRHSIGSKEWYAKTPKGWYWVRLDAREPKWAFVPYGPPGTHWTDM